MRWKKGVLLMRAVLCALTFFCTHTNFSEYLYPVAFDEHGQFVYVMYQKTAAHIELWKWDPVSLEAEQLLFSRYSPAGVQILPDFSGFSFMDDGILKIKKHMKRSPRSIEFNVPLRSVQVVNWIDAQRCYTSGILHDYYGIFEIDWDGIVSNLACQDGVDFLYPQKVDDALFFVTRDAVESNKYTICVKPYSFIDTMTERIVKREELISRNNPIAFLRMITQNRGYYVSYAPQLSSRDPIITFSYHELQKTEAWIDRKLFSFSIPSYLITKGEKRLYESILPLLPKIDQKKIYFVDCKKSQTLQLCQYDLALSEIEVIANENSHIIGLLDKIGLFGGELADKGRVAFNENGMSFGNFKC